MAINYDDDRFTNLEKEEAAAKKEANSTYDNLISESSKYYQDLIDQSKDWADKQADIQNRQTEFAIQKIEQQKEQAKKDYTKEQKGAYQDYMRQSNAYGSNMQTAGQAGLGGSGWSETIQAGFYNTYQNRYAAARESYNTIVMNYDNNMKEAQLQNSSALAQIYANAQQQQLELALQQFTVIKDLELNKLNTEIALDSEYADRWRQIEAQINTENSLAEQIRQYNASLAEQKRQADLDYQYKQAALAEQKRQFDKEYAAKYSSGGGGGSATLKGGSDGGSTKKETTSSSNTTLKTGSSGREHGGGGKSFGSSSSGTVKLSNGKTGYSSAIDAYKASGGTTPYSAANLVKKGLVKEVSYNGKTYYYAK